MTCPVPGCPHHHVYSTAGNLAAHTRSVHGWIDPFDTRLQTYLETFGFTQCGQDCRSGAGVGATWLRFSVRCNVPTQHLDCPHYAQHKHRHEHRVLLGKEATKVLPLLELRKNDGEDSLAFHVRAVVEQMRGGAVAGTEVATARRLQAMLASKFVGRPASELPSHVTQLQANILQCSKLLREPVPQVSRAMRALGRGQRFDVRSEADQALVQSLFPQGDALPPPTFAETRWAAPRIDDDAVNRLIKRKDSLSAAGLSGHGIKAMKGLRKRGRHWVTALRLVSQAVADCWFTGTEAEDAVTACALTLVAKPGGGKPRPIGVGEAVVNLARTVAAGALLRQIQASHPLDFGLASTCGTDACVALVRAKLRAGPGNVAILLDFSNAFGSLSRVAILKGALQYCPQAVPLLRAAYATDGLAYYALANGETATLRATRGVRQGDRQPGTAALHAGHHAPARGHAGPQHGRHALVVPGRPATDRPGAGGSRVVQVPASPTRADGLVAQPEQVPRAGACGAIGRRARAVRPGGPHRGRGLGRPAGLAHWEREQHAGVSV